MLTKAGKQALYTMTNWTANNNAQNAKAMFPEDSIRNTTNVQRWVSFVNGNLISHLNCVGNTYAGFSIGSGTTAVSDSDYFLENQITSGYSMTLIHSIRGLDISQKPYMEFWFIVENISANNMTIGEIGLTSTNIYCTNTASATSAGGNNVMIDRTVFENPITLSPQESCKVKYRITSDISFT